MKKLFATFILIITLSIPVWQSIIYIERYNQPIEVVDVIKSDSGFYDYLILKHPPLNEKKFVRWWQDNKDDIKSQYDVPSIRSYGDGVFKIGIWALGEGFDINKDGQLKDNGYLFERYEQFCIDELPQEKRCLERKNHYAGVGRARDGWFFIDFMKGNVYIHQGDEQFVKSQYGRLSDSMKQLLTRLLLIFVISLLLGRNIYDLFRSKASTSKQ